MTVLDYKSENCSVDCCSDMTPEEAENVIGKTIIKINALEHSLLITFSDKSTLNMNGGRWCDCIMGVDFETT